MRFGNPPSRPRRCWINTLAVTDDFVARHYRWLPQWFSLAVEKEYLRQLSIVSPDPDWDWIEDDAQ